jgi:hypothetical protein
MLTLSLLLAAAGTASAQDAKKVGITMGYPTSVGVLWHVSDKVAIRPELSFGGGTAETTGSGISVSSDNFTVTTGVSALFYLHTDDKLRTYVTPRFTYSHASTTSDSSSITNFSAEQTGNATGVQGLFGAQYGLGNRFAVFGELGFGFAHTTQKSSSSPTKGTSDSWGTRSAVGIVFYP